MAYLQATLVGIKTNRAETHRYLRVFLQCHSLRTPVQRANEAAHGNSKGSYDCCVRADSSAPTETEDHAHVNQTKDIEVLIPTLVGRISTSHVPLTSFHKHTTRMDLFTFMLYYSLETLLLLSAAVVPSR